MTRSLHCAVLDDYQQAALASADWSPLSDRLEVTVFREPVRPGDFAARLGGFEIIVAMRERTAFDDAAFAQLPSLKLLVTTGMSNAAIDLASADRHGVAVVGTRGLAGPAAELAWGLLLAVMRNLPAECTNFRAGGRQWQISIGRGLQGKVLGVVGLGKLGSRVAAYGNAFGMDVLGWSRNNSPERCGQMGIGYSATLDELLGNSDVVTLHLGLNEETRGIIGEAELARMKDGSVLVNTARGALVDEDALIAALRGGRLAGAGLDVFATEPLEVGHPLRRMQNVVATPHLGYVTHETYSVYFGDVVEGIAAWLDRKPVRMLNRSGVAGAAARP